MKITIDGKNFELNVEACKQAGFLKPVRENITDFQFGDVFGGRYGSRIIVAQLEYHQHDKQAFCLLGLGGLKTYLNTGGPLTEDQVLEFLNKEEYNYLGNINDVILSAVSAMKEKR